MPTRRTTLRIDDELYRRVKAEAARRGRTVSDVIEDAVRDDVRPQDWPGRYLRCRSTGARGCSPAST